MTIIKQLDITEYTNHLKDQGIDMDEAISIAKRVLNRKVYK